METIPHKTPIYVGDDAEPVPGAVFTPESQAQRLVDFRRLAGQTPITLDQARRQIADQRQRQRGTMRAHLRVALPWRASPKRRVPAPSRTSP